MLKLECVPNVEEVGGRCVEGVRDPNVEQVYDPNVDEVRDPKVEEIRNCLKQCTLSFVTVIKAGD